MALVASSFIGEKTQGIVKELLTLPSTDWWRVRTFAEVNQQFGTDLFGYLLHKPLSLLQVRKSINELRKIKESGNLNYTYVSNRLISAIGLDPKRNTLEDIFPELAKSIKLTFSSNKEVARDSSLKIYKLIAPIFGLFGFFAVTAGVPLKAILKVFDKESKFINAFTQSGVTSQQLSYLFGFVLPEQFENQIQPYAKNNPELNKLKEERNRLFYTGAGTCFANVLSTFLKLVSTESKHIQTGIKVIDELAESGINYFFSRRRELIGKEYRLNNPEVYITNGKAKIISDKASSEHGVAA